MREHYAERLECACFSTAFGTLARFFVDVPSGKRVTFQSWTGQIDMRTIANIVDEIRGMRHVAMFISPPVSTLSPSLREDLRPRSQAT